MKRFSREHRLLVIIYLGFISLGLPDGTLGVAWPAIYRELELPIGLAGPIMTVATLLTAAAGFSSGWILARWRTGPVLVTSVLLTSAGLLLLARAGGGVGLFAAAVPLGLGAGAVDAALNGYVARHYRGRHMNWLHACWGIGATIGPVLFGWALGPGPGWRGGYVVLGAVQLALVVLFLLALPLWHTATGPSPAASGETTEPPRAPTTRANSPAGWLSVGLFAVYVAAEMTTGLWAGTVLVVHRGFPPEVAAWCTAAFFGTLTAARIGAGFVVDHWGNRRVITGGVLVALAGVGGFLLAPTPLWAGAALVVAGAGLAPIYPGLMHEVPRRFAPEAVMTVIGRQSGGGALGAAVGPAVAGALAQQALGLVPALALGLLVVLFLGLRRLDRLT